MGSEVGPARQQILTSRVSEDRGVKSFVMGVFSFWSARRRCADKRSTPLESIQLWPGKPPQGLENPPPGNGRRTRPHPHGFGPHTHPYLPPHANGKCRALIVFAGGGYGGHDWRTHVVYAADYLLPKGVAVIGLKYRTRPPYRVSNDEIQAITLTDAKRAVRLVRAKAADGGSIRTKSASPATRPVRTWR